MGSKGERREYVAKGSMIANLKERRISSRRFSDDIYRNDLYTQRDTEDPLQQKKNGKTGGLLADSWLNSLGPVYLVMLPPG